MDAPSALHPTDQTLSSFGLGKLEDGPAEAVNKHLEQCPDCRQRVSEMSADSFLDRVRDAQGAGKSTVGAKKTSAPPPADTLPPGLADHPDYEIKRELGRGGMGVVYLAHNTLMGRDEVLKVMGRQIMERPGVLDRFIREIRAVAKLRHPNIVTAYSAVRLGESIVFAMEYIDGLDLSKMVKSKGPLPVAHACNFVYQSALGLQHAHEEGLVHRDIKPANLMLSRKGDKVTVKVLDFGLAKVTREEKVDGGLTSEGQALGTPDFIAPEQILDAPSADIRADIYSLGGTLYYLLTGRPPFKANSLYDMYQAHISRDADLLNMVRPEVPAELAALVAKMMAKDPNRRFQTPGEVAQALTPFFKKANAAFKSPRTDVSQAGQTNASRPVNGSVSTPTQPATDAGGPFVQAKKAAEPTVTETEWGSLIKLGETERSPEAAKPAPETSAGLSRRPPWMTWPVIAAASLFGFIALGIIITITIDKGRTTMSVVEKTDDGHVGHGSASLPGVPPTSSPTVTSTEPLTPVRGGDSIITNSIGMKLALIPAGEFLMGSPDDDKGAQANERPQHRVRITRPFYMGIYEVTQGQYRAVAGVNPSQFNGSDDLPVERVSWFEAVEFCNALSEKDRLKPFYRIERIGGNRTMTIPDRNGHGYRLPTEAEWEYACRAGSTTKFSFGDDATRLGEFGWYDGNSDRKTQKVGQKRPNAWGLYDLHGNVWEWCWDSSERCYEPTNVGYHEQPRVDDPLGPPQAAYRVHRGGSWSDGFRVDRSARRYALPAGHREINKGFRLVRAQSDSAGGGGGGCATRGGGGGG
jgi:formylglycine-generating enzyme required for sulfatase activity/serine/threonine protein kinase